MLSGECLIDLKDIPSRFRTHATSVHRETGASPNLKFGMSARARRGVADLHRCSVNVDNDLS